MAGPGIIRRPRMKLDARKLLAGPRRVKVGFPAGKADQDNLDKAFWNEFGTVNIPERPFMRNALRNNRKKYREAVKADAPELLAGRVTADQLLRKLGQVAQDDIKMEIETLRTPPNAPSTIARKKSSNPLIDTGEMRQAVTYEVVK